MVYINILKLMILLKNKQYYYWNEKSVSPWIKYNNEMNYKFENISKLLFENINLKKNQSILDIGCGAGQTSYVAKKSWCKWNYNGSRYFYTFIKFI